MESFLQISQNVPRNFARKRPAIDEVRPVPLLIILSALAQTLGAESLRRSVTISQ
jgi:hypothetical protein